MASNIYPVPASGGATYINPTHLMNSPQTVTVTTSFAAGYYMVTPSVVSSYSFTVGDISKTFTGGDIKTAFLTSLTTSQTSMTMTAPTSYIGWSAATTALNQGFVTCIVYGNSKYIAGGQTGTIFSTTNGVTWATVVNNAIGTNYLISDIAYNATPTNKFVAVGESGGLATSTDGTTWTTRTSGFGTSTINGVAAGTTTEKYVICGTYANGAAPIVKSSTDGVTWTARTVTTSTSNGISVTFGGVWVVTGQNGALWTSTDAITWSTRTSGSTVPLAVTYANSLYWSIDANGVLRNSTDAITWTQKATGLGGYSGGDWSGKYDIVYFNSKYHFVNSVSVLRSSTDGVTWEGPYGTAYIGLATSGTEAVVGTGYYTTNGNIVTTSTFMVNFTYLGTATNGA